MKFLSVCSGIEAASVAWSPLGWSAVAFSEIEPFPCAVLAHHYPDTPNWGDMNNYKDWPDVSIDLLCGGTPCQSFSVAGLRKGLDDPRGNLMLTFGAIAAKYRPKWLVWENVPGVLSSAGGADFASFLGLLTGQIVEVPEGGWANSGVIAGIADAYGIAWRVFDAQYFGVPQRRRRVFVVGCLGDWRSAAAVLFERHGLSGDPAPRRQTGQSPTGTLSARTEGGGGIGIDFDLAGGCVPVASRQVAGVANRNNPKAGDPCHPLAAGAHPPGIAYSTKLHNTQSNQAGKVYEEYTAGLDRNSPPPALLTAMQVRRLTPKECARLQGFEDTYLDITFRKKPAADGPKYKALGNSWAVPNVRWIGERIEAVSTINALRKAA